MPDPAPVAAYRRALPDLPVYEIDITPLDRIGVPVWTAAQWQPDGELCNSMGYGDTPERARIGAWGELCERVAAHRGTAHLPRIRASHVDLCLTGQPALDPLRLRLPVGTDYRPERRLTWVQVKRYAPGTPDHEQEVWAPVEAVASNFADAGSEGEHDGDWLFTPITNGLGAGDTLERALAHGLLELVQRDGNSAGYRALDRGIEVELDDVWPQTRALLDRYEREGVRVVVKLAETPLGIVSLYVAGVDRPPGRAPHPIVLTASGEGADPDARAAAHKALTEFAGSRARKLFNHGPIAPMEGLFPDGYLDRVRAQPAQLEEARSFEHMRAWMALSPEETVARLQPEVLNVTSTVKLSNLPSTELPDRPAARLADLYRRFSDEGLDIYYADLMPDNADARAVKVIVPGMEVETLTYGRVGRRNLERMIARGSDLVGLGEAPGDALRVTLPASDEEALGGPAWFRWDEARRRADRLYALYREPSRHVLALADERAQ
jgi:ribosomal protein S12 methylthiotransferase accessory factor